MSLIRLHATPLVLALLLVVAGSGAVARPAHATDGVLAIDQLCAAGDGFATGSCASFDECSASEKADDVYDEE
jgi:hypothetical protein